MLGILGTKVTELLRIRARGTRARALLLGKKVTFFGKGYIHVTFFCNLLPVAAVIHLVPNRWCGIIRRTLGIYRLSKGEPAF